MANRAPYPPDRIRRHGLTIAMLCDRVLDNLDSPTAATLTAGRTIDPLDVTWIDLHRRSLRGTTRGGRPVGVLLPLGVRLGHGDILHADPQSLVAVNLVPADVITGSPKDLRQMGLIAFELGNLHLPVEIGDDSITTLRDGPAEAIFRRYELPFRTETRRFTPLRASVLNNVRLSPTFRVEPANVAAPGRYMDRA
jgi:urease accessory protein